MYFFEWVVLKKGATLLRVRSVASRPDFGPEGCAVAVNSPRLGFCTVDGEQHPESTHENRHAVSHSEHHSVDVGVLHSRDRVGDAWRLQLGLYDVAAALIDALAQLLAEPLSITQSC